MIVGSVKEYLKIVFIILFSLFNGAQVGVFAQNFTSAVYDPSDKGVETAGSLSVGKFYRFFPKPLSEHPDIFPCVWSDGSKLTDESFNKGSDLDPGRYVGWNGVKPVEIIFDLGRAQLVEELEIHGKYLPVSVKVFIREGKEKWKLQTETGKFKTVSKDQAFHEKIPVDALKGRYVKILMNPQEDRGLFLDEVNVLGRIKNTWRYVPSKGAFHGAFPTSNGFSAQELNGRKGMVIDLFEQKVGKKISMVLWYQNMQPGRNFSEIQTLRKQHLSENFNGIRHFMFGWLPHKQSITPIAQGSLDNYFKEYFEDSVDPAKLDGIDAPIFFRPMNEFNGNWVSWSLNPADFKRAWRRMYNIAEQTGAAQKHVFVWSPNFRSYPNNENNKMQLYYPGDQYVDWVGLSAYPPGAHVVPEDERYPINVVKEAYDLYAHYKPFMITEGAFSKTSDRFRWTKEWFELKNERPKIKAVVWENHLDRIISLDSASLAHYRKMVQDDYWLSETAVKTKK